MGTNDAASQLAVAGESDVEAGGSRAKRAGLNRKQFLGAAALTSASAFAAACGSGGSADDAPAAAGDGANLPKGAPRGLNVVWALAAIDAWNTPIDVGFNDATRLLGWNYKKVGLPVSQYSPENVVRVINQAIQTRPDILVTPAWVPGVYDAVKAAQDKGILVLLNNANGDPEKATELGVPYVGEDGRPMGRDLGLTLLQYLVDNGKRSGVVLAGNNFPGNNIVEDRLWGIRDAIAAFNDEKGTDFKYDELVDQASDSAKGVALYKTKMTQVGPDLVALAGLGAAQASIHHQALVQQGKKPGEVAVGGFEISGEMPTLLREGWVNVTIDANYYAEGFLPVMLAWQQKSRGVETKDVYTCGYAVVTRDTLAAALQRQEQVASLAKDYGVTVN